MIIEVVAPAYRTDEILERLKTPNTLVVSNRRTGKTRALIQHIHNTYRGAAFVVVPTHEAAEAFRAAYQDLYPGGDIPTTLTPGPNTARIANGSYAVFVEEFYLVAAQLGYEHAQELAKVLTGAVASPRGH
jgi:hypothetical protein